MRTRKYLFGPIAVLFLVLAVCQTTINACPFCTQGKGPTLIGDFKEAKLVVYGTFTNPKLDAAGEFQAGTTDFKIEHIFKDHPICKNKKLLTLPIYRKKTDAKFVVFCDVFKGNVDPYRGVQADPDGELVKYLKGAVKIKDSSTAERLKYCFKFLNSSDFEVAMDAYREFAVADYKDYEKIAKDFDNGLLVKWLTDDETPAFRYGLYSSLLGHCGTVDDIKVLEDMLSNPKKRDSSGIDGMFAGYVFLLDKHKKTTKALEFLQDVLSDTKQEFMMRWTALRTLRFLKYNRPDILTEKEIVDTVALALRHKDMADFAIEDFRKWECWEMTPKVLELFGKESHKAAVIKRSILRFALQCPREEAKQFVQAQQKRDAEWVAETQELLELEASFSSD